MSSCWTKQWQQNSKYCNFAYLCFLKYHTSVQLTFIQLNNFNNILIYNYLSLLENGKQKNSDVIISSNSLTIVMYYFQLNIKTPVEKVSLKLLIEHWPTSHYSWLTIIYFIFYEGIDTLSSITLQWQSPYTRAQLT